MPRFIRITPKKALKILLKLEFYIHHKTGSHINLRHSTKTYLHVVIPYHHKDLAPKTLKSILSQAGITIEEFNKLISKQ